MIKALIFDCFGVLVTDALQVLHNDLRQRDPAGAEEITSLIRASNRGIIDPKDSNKRVAAIFGTTVDDYAQQIRDGEVKNTELLAYITELHGRYKTAILSNISATGLAKRFSAEELAAGFDTVVSSGEIGYAKPDRRAYEIAAERLGVAPEECVFIDDREGFCVAASDLGMQSIVYTDFVSFKHQLEALLTE